MFFGLMTCILTGLMGAKVGEMTGSGVRLMGANVGGPGKPMVTLSYPGTAVLSMVFTLIMRKFSVLANLGIL